MQDKYHFWHGGRLIQSSSSNYYFLFNVEEVCPNETDYFDRLAILLCIEYAWNIFPSTPLSSGILLVANAALLIGTWLKDPAP